MFKELLLWAPEEALLAEEKTKMSFVNLEKEPERPQVKNTCPLITIVDFNAGG